MIRSSARADIETARMKRAFDLTAFDEAFRQRRGAVRAGVVGGENSVVQAKHGNRFRARYVDTACFVLRECGIRARTHPS